MDFGTKYNLASQFAAAATDVTKTLDKADQKMMAPDIGLDAGILNILMSPMTAGVALAGTEIIQGTGDPVMKLQTAGERDHRDGDFGLGEYGGSLFLPWLSD